MHILTGLAHIIPEVIPEVIPAKAGNQRSPRSRKFGIPAFAGMTQRAACAGMTQRAACAGMTQRVTSAGMTNQH
jgi:hypothetical protein